jgi:RimJ/RimL family protein N-acetyltransferase
MTQAACVTNLPVLTQDDVCLREVCAADAAALVALFARPEVSAHLSPPPANVEAFHGWIDLSHARRIEGRAACYTLLTGSNQDVSGLFMALRRESAGEAELGFAMAPHLWGTGVFMRAARIYLNFLFTEWGVTRLVGHTLKRNERGVGAMKKLGATVIDTVDKKGEPEFVWTITAAEWRARAAPRTS